MFVALLIALIVVYASATKILEQDRQTPAITLDMVNHINVSDCYSIPIHHNYLTTSIFLK